MLVGFGAWGAVIGVVAAALPALITALSDTTEEIEDQESALESLDAALNNLGKTTQQASLQSWIDEWVTLDEKQRAAHESMLAYQTTALRVAQEQATGPLAELFNIQQVTAPETGGLDTRDLQQITQNRQIKELLDNIGLEATQLAQVLPLYEDVIDSRGEDADAINALADSLRAFYVEGGVANEELKEQINLMDKLARGAENLARAQGTIVGARQGTLTTGTEGPGFVGPPSSGAGSGDMSQRELAAMEEFRKAWNQNTDSIVDDTTSAWDVMFTSFDDNFESMVTGIAQGTQSIEDAFDSLVQSVVADLAKLAAEWLANAAISALFGGSGTVTANANGNVISGGNVQPFAKGGVVSGPTLFPMSRGAGLMGEAGPEAIMPLGRNSRGELGVKAAPMNVIVNNMAPGVQAQPRQTDEGLIIDVVLQQVANGIRRGGTSISGAIEDTYGVGRGRSVY